MKINIFVNLNNISYSSPKMKILSFTHLYQVAGPIDFHILEENILWTSMGTILHNILFHVPQKKDTLTSLEQHEGCK